MTQNLDGFKEKKNICSQVRKGNKYKKCKKNIFQKNLSCKLRKLVEADGPVSISLYFKALTLFKTHQINKKTSMTETHCCKTHNNICRTKNAARE